MVLYESECTPAHNFAAAKLANHQRLSKVGRTSSAKSAYGGKLLNLLDDSCLRRGLKLRIHGKREDFRSNFLGDREVTFLETKPFVGLLQM
jgi:hypothetical protein